MQVFELYFNPRRPGFKGQKKNEQEVIFDSFCYEPENVYERKLGSLYVIGELKNALPQNLRFLEKIAQLLKERYYSNYLKSPEGALKESLRALNDFFQEEVKRDNTNWLGNLELVIISTGPQQKIWAELNFTKIGKLKILLLRENQISDIGAQLKLQEIEPYPLKVFSNIVSGKISEGDIIAIFTEGVFKFFQEKNLIQKMSQEKNLRDKKIKEILKPEEKELNKISGICLLIQSQQETNPKLSLAFKENLGRFSFSQTMKNFYYSLTRGIAPFKRFLTGFAKLKFFKFLFRNLKNSEINNKISKITPSENPLLKEGARTEPRRGVTLPNFKFSSLNKNLILICLLIFILFVGFLFSQKEKGEEIRSIKNTLQEIESKTSQAENFLLLKDEEKANALFQEALQEVLPLTKKTAPLAESALTLKKSIEEKLQDLNKLEKIETPETLFAFDAKEINLTPYKMLLSNSTLYFYNPFSKNIYKLGIEKRAGSLLEGNREPQFGVQYQDSILFFTKPNFIISLKNDEFQEKTFELPNFNDLASFRSNIYFLDSGAGEITTYSPPSNKTAVWLNPETQKAESAKSIAVDGSVWLLTKDNQINRYYRGNFQETLKINLFPQFKNPTKIWTSASLPNLYLLEPAQNRVIILTKTGKIVKQYQSEKFDNLLDFNVSADGKIIWVLNDLKVYQINMGND